MNTKEIVEKFKATREELWKLQEEWIKENQKGMSEKIDKIEEQIKNLQTDIDALREMYREKMAEKYHIY